MRFAIAFGASLAALAVVGAGLALMWPELRERIVAGVLDEARAQSPTLRAAL